MLEPGNSTSNTSPETLLAHIRSAPLTPNNRANMPPAASELDPLTSHLSLPTAPKPITSADALSLSISHSTYASHYTISKALLVRNPVCSSLDLNKVQVKKEEKEKSRRSNRDTHSAPSSIQHRQAFQYRSRNHSKTEGSASYQLDHAMRYRDDYRVPTSCTEKENRGNTKYNKAKAARYPYTFPATAARLLFLVQGRKDFHCA